MGFSFLNKLNLPERYRQLKHGERLLLLGAIMTALVLGADLAVARPLWNYYVSMGEQTAAEERKLVRNLLNISRKEIVEKGYEEYQKFLHPPTTDEEEIGRMLSEIEERARNNKVILVDMKPREPRPYDFYKEYVVELDAEMEMASWIYFMHQLEESSQLIRVTSAKLTRKGGDQPLAKAKMTVIKTLLLEKQ